VLNALVSTITLPTHSSASELTQLRSALAQLQPTFATTPPRPARRPALDKELPSSSAMQLAELHHPHHHHLLPRLMSVSKPTKPALKAPLDMDPPSVSATKPAPTPTTELVTELLPILTSVTTSTRLARRQLLDTYALSKPFFFFKTLINC